MTIAIEFKQDSVNLAEVRIKGSTMELRRSHSISIPEEWIDSEGVREEEMLAMLVSQEIKDFDFKSKDLIICVNNPSIIYRELLVPKVDSKRLGLVVRSEMMEVLNLTPEYIMDYVVLEEITDEEGIAKVRLLAVASLSKAVASYIEVAKKMKLKLVGIDTSTNAVLKFVEASQDLTNNDQMILVDIGNTHLRLYLFENGKYVLSRNAKLLPAGASSDYDVGFIVEDHINKMIQFSYTRINKTGDKIVVLAGNRDLVNNLKARVEEDLLVKCDVLMRPEFLKGTADFSSEYINVIGSLIRK